MKKLTIFLAAIFMLAGCAENVVQPDVRSEKRADKGDEVVLYALGLLGIDYRFGGANPESGLDCSGMVSYIYKNAVGIELPHNAYKIAQLTKPMSLSEIRPGDLVFFDTLHRPYSHVGIYIGKGRFVHAPKTNGKIMISDLNSAYYARHIDGMGSLFR